PGKRTGDPLLQSRDASGRRDAGELEPLVLDHIGVVLWREREALVDRGRFRTRTARTLALRHHAGGENCSCLLARKRRKESRKLELRRRVAGAPFVLPVGKAEPIEPTESDLDAADAEREEEMAEDACAAEDASNAGFLQQQRESKRGGKFADVGTWPQ